MAADGIKPVGVELVAQGSAAFTSALNKGAASLGAFERAGKAAAAGINIFDQVVIGALRRVGELGVNALMRAGRELLNFGINSVQAAAQGHAFNTTLDTLGDRLLGIIRFNIDPLLNQFDNLIQKSTPAIEGWVAFLSQTFSQVGQNALTWGQNIANQLGQGIYDGAQAVLDALIYIGNLITSWLMPGSPPKLLPDIDDWGRETAEVWLQGWTKADFSILSTIGGQIEGLLRSQAPRNDTGLVARILGTREAIAQAVQQARQMGQVTAGALDAIYKAAGATTPQVKDYLRSVFNLDLANESLTTAQLELNRATQKYQDLLKPVDAELRRISESQQQFTEDQEKSRLALILKDPNATADEKRQAALRLEEIAAERNRRAIVAEQAAVVETAQTKVDAAEAAVAVAQVEFDANKARIDALIEQNNLIREQTDLLAKLAATAAAPKALAGGGGGKGVGGVLPIDVQIPPELQAAIDALMAKVTTLKETWQTAWDAIGAAMKPVTDAWKAHVVPGLETLQTKFNESMPAIQDSIGRMVAFAVANLNITLPGVFRNVEKSLTSMGNIWEQTHKGMLWVVETVFAYIWTIISVALTIVSGIIAVSLRVWEFMFKQFSLLLKGDWKGMWENIQSVMTDIEDTIEDTLNTALSAILLLAGTDLETFNEVWDGIFANIGIIVETFVGKIGGWVADAVAFFQPLIDALQFINNNVPSIPGINAPGGGGSSGGTVSPPASGSPYAQSNVSNAPTYNYTYSPTYQGSPVAPQLDFAAMNVWAAS